MVVFDLQDEFPDLDSKDPEGEETGKDITGTYIESQNQEAEAAADDVLPVQIERQNYSRMSEDESNTPMLEPRSNKINHIQRTKWTPLEVVITLYFVALVFNTIVQQYYVITIIAEKHNQSNFINHEMSSCNNSKSDNSNIQKDSSELLMYLGLCSTFLSVFAIMFLGSLADRLGRKLVLCVCLVGVLVKEIICVIVIHYKFSVYALFLGQIAEGLTGAFGGVLMTIFGMVADITIPGKTRALRISVVEGVGAIISGLSLIAVGYWVKYSGFVFPMLFSLILTILSIIFCVLFIPETSKIESRTEKSCSVAYLLKCGRLYCHNNSAGRRSTLIIALLILVLAGIALFGRPNTLTLFLLNNPLCWTEVHIQICNAVITLVNWGIVIVVVHVLHAFVQDYGILIIGTFSAASSMFLLSFATKDWMVYLYVVLGLFSTSMFPMLRAMMSRQCTPEEQGSLFATLSSTELLFTACSQLIYGVIYNWSVSFFPGLAFLVMASVLVIALLFSMLLYKCMVRDNKYI